MSSFDEDSEDEEFTLSHPRARPQRREQTGLGASAPGSSYQEPIRTRSRESANEQPSNNSLHDTTSTRSHVHSLSNVAEALQRAGRALEDVGREVSAGDVDNLAQEVFKGQWEAERITRWAGLLVDSCKLSADRHRIRMRWSDLDGAGGKRKRA